MASNPTAETLIQIKASGRRRDTLSCEPAKAIDFGVPCKKREKVGWQIRPNHRMNKHTWYVTFEVPWRGTAVRSRRSRSTQTFETETEAKDFARAKFDDGLVVTAGTIIPHLPRCAIPSGSISSWLGEGREQDSGDAAESTDPQSGKTE